MYRASTNYLPSATARPRVGTTFIHAAPRHSSIQATTTGLFAAYGPSRRSVLRHLRLDSEEYHAMSPAAMTAHLSALGAPRRTRQPIACDPCRASKRKCSGGLPCDSCVRRGPNIFCHYDAASALKVRTRAELRGRPRGRRGHVRTRDFRTPQFDTLQLGAGLQAAHDHRRLGIHQRRGFPHGHNHLASQSPCHLSAVSLQREPDREGRSAYYTGLPVDAPSTHRHPAASTLSSYSASDEEYSRSQHGEVSIHDALSRQQRRAMSSPESTRSATASAEEKGGSEDAEDDDDDDDEYMETSPIFRGLVLDRVHLRKPDNLRETSAVQEEGRSDTLGCRTLPSIESLLNVSHTRASATLPHLIERDSEEAPSGGHANKGIGAFEEPQQSGTTPFRPWAQNNFDPYKGRGAAPHDADTSQTMSTLSRREQRFPALPRPLNDGPTMGFTGHHRETLRLGETVARTVPVLPLPSEPHRNPHGWYSGEHAGEEQSLQRHRGKPREESQGWQSRQVDDHGQANSLPEWIKPLPFSRLPRGLCHHRLGTGSATTRLDSQAQPQGRTDLRPNSARGVAPSLDAQISGKDGAGHAASQGVERRSCSSHFDEHVSRRSSQDFADERSHDRRLSSERIPVSQRRF